MTPPAANLLLGVLAGLALGAVFYAGLWATVRHAHRVRWPSAWIVGSFVLRAALVGIGLLLLARNGPWTLASALAGFAAARPLVTRAVLGRETRDDSVA